MKEELTFAQFGRIYELTRGLKNLTHLPYINIVPAEIVGYGMWEETVRSGTNEFNARLGAAAANIISHDLRTLLTLKSAKQGLLPNNVPEPFRIGVAGGQATYFAIDGMPELNAGLTEVEIAPLVIGSVPQHRYSAGTNAEMLASKIICQVTVPGIPDVKQSASVIRMEEWSERATFAYNVKIKDDIRQQRDTLGNNLAGFFDFDYILVGIGQYSDLSHQITNLSVHIKTCYNGVAPKGLVGDICSRLFDSNGGELDKERQDRFVAISFRALELLVSKCTPVMVVAGGLSKVDAINTIAVLRRHHPLPVINGLITDELTAIQLLKMQ